MTKTSIYFVDERPFAILFLFENGLRWLFLLFLRSMDECSDGRRALGDNRPEH